MINNNGLDQEKTTKSMKVILWGREDVIGQGVEFLLRSRKDWEVTRIFGDNDYQDLTEEVQKLNPDVVIVYQGDFPKDPNWPLQLMEGRPGIKVITFSLEDSSLEVYDKKKVWVKNVSDLLDRI